MSEPLSATDLVSAQSSLDHLMAKVGVDGIVAALRSPWLLAALDQHVAAIREGLSVAGREVDAVSLARYARSVRTVAGADDHDLPDGNLVDWRTAEWYLLRLVAVCALADAEECL